MSNLYETISYLCDSKGIKRGKMCEELHLSRGLMTDLKMGRKQTIALETAIKIADYFDISVSELMTGVRRKEPATISDDELDSEIFQLISVLHGDRQKAAVDYLRFLVHEQEAEGK